MPVFDGTRVIVKLGALFTEARNVADIYLLACGPLAGAGKVDRDRLEYRVFWSPAAESDTIAASGIAPKRRFYGTELCFIRRDNEIQSLPTAPGAAFDHRLGIEDDALIN